MRVVVSTVLGVALMWVPAPAGAQLEPPLLLGEFSFPSGSSFQGTTVGGLSGLTHDPGRDLYYAVSDDRGQFGPPRFYTLQIDLALDGINDVRVLSVTILDSNAESPGIQPYEQNDSDLEEIVLLPDGELLISSERDRNGQPWVRRFALDGSLLGELPVPDKFAALRAADALGRESVVKGVRTNLGFEGMALSPDGGTLYVANEEALAQDGPIASLNDGTNVRLMEYDLRAPNAQLGREYVYPTEKIFAQPQPPNEFADNGVSSMLWIGHLLPDFDILVMERSFATGVGVDVSVYGVRLEGADDVSSLEALASPFTGRTLDKTLLLNMAQAGVVADNLEAMTLGPVLPSGNPSLILMSDDNFSASGTQQVNQFILFEIDLVRLRESGVAVRDGRQR